MFNKKVDVNMKSKGLLFVKYYEKTDDGFVLTDDIMVKIKKKDFIKSLTEDLENGIEHKIEYVNKKPERFRMGILYVLHTPKGRPDYIYTHQING